MIRTVVFLTATLARFFRAQAEAARDENVFRTPEGRTDHVTLLPDGVFVTGDPALDGAGRPERHLWSVVDPVQIHGWSTAWTVRRPVPGTEPEVGGG